MDDLKATLELRIDRLETEIGSVSAQRQACESQERRLREDLHACQTVLGHLTGETEPADSHAVLDAYQRVFTALASGGGEGKARAHARQDNGPLDDRLRAVLQDGKEHHLNDILDDLTQRYGAVIARSTARNRLERMAGVKKKKGELVYRFVA